MRDVDGIFDLVIVDDNDKTRRALCARADGLRAQFFAVEAESLFTHAIWSDRKLFTLDRLGGKVLTCSRSGESERRAREEAKKAQSPTKNFDEVRLSIRFLVRVDHDTG